MNYFIKSAQELYDVDICISFSSFHNQKKAEGELTLKDLHEAQACTIAATSASTETQDLKQ